MHARMLDVQRWEISAAGAWWFWVDACAASHTQVPFVQYLPGLIATLALIMINAIRRCAPAHTAQTVLPAAPLFFCSMPCMHALH